MRFAHITITVIVAAAACRPPASELTEEHRDALADTVRQVMMELYAAANRVDADALLGYFADDAVLAVQGAMISGDLFAERVRRSFAGLRAQNARSRDMRIDVLGPNAAVVTDYEVFSATDTAGVTTPELTAAHTAVMVRRNGRWMCIHAHESFPPAGPG